MTDNPTPTPTPEPNHTPIPSPNLGGDPTAVGGDPWYAKAELGLSQEARDFLGAKNYASIEDQIKAHRQFETLARDRNAITGPAPGKELEWEGWEKHLGWTPDATKYGVEKPKLKDGVPYTPEFHDTFVKTLHANKVPPVLAKAIIEGMGKHYESTHEATLHAIAAEDAAVTAELKQEWGANFTQNEELAKRAAQFFGIGQEDMAELEDVIRSPRLVKMFHKLGAAMGEDKLVSPANGGQGGFGSQSPATARAQRLALEADKDFVASLGDARHPLHAINTEKHKKLFDLEAGRT